MRFFPASKLCSLYGKFIFFLYKQGKWQKKYIEILSESGVSNQELFFCSFFCFVAISLFIKVRGVTLRLEFSFDIQMSSHCFKYMHVCKGICMGMEKICFIIFAK